MSIATSIENLITVKNQLKDAILSREGINVSESDVENATLSEYPSFIRKLSTAGQHSYTIPTVNGNTITFSSSGSEWYPFSFSLFNTSSFTLTNTKTLCFAVGTVNGNRDPKNTVYSGRIAYIKNGTPRYEIVDNSVFTVTKTNNNKTVTITLNDNSITIPDLNCRFYEFRVSD